MEEKYCPSCKKHKRLEDFHKRRSSPTGRTSYCKECVHIREDRKSYGIGQYHPPAHERFWFKVQKNEHCWIWTGAKTGAPSHLYGVIHVDGKPMKTHRFSYILHHGDIPDHLIVCHTCDNPLCVNPEHLWLGTLRDNALDAIQKGKMSSVGSQNPKAKLSEEDILYIRNHPKYYGYAVKLSRQFGVDAETIYAITSRRTWAHM